MAAIDHMILNVKELDASVDFYVNIMGFKLEGEDGPFTVVRVNKDFILLISPYGTKQGQHIAFSLSRQEFDATLARVKAKGIPYGQSYDSIGTNTGPGVESGAKGSAPTVYFDDPSTNLIEIRTYE